MNMHNISSICVVEALTLIQNGTCSHGNSDLFLRQQETELEEGTVQVKRRTISFGNQSISMLSLVCKNKELSVTEIVKPNQVTSCQV